MFSSYKRFPEVILNGAAPEESGVFDKEKRAGTPIYAYGWILSRVELYEALNDGEVCPWDRLLDKIHFGADQRFNSIWEKSGYDKNEYNPPVPGVMCWGPGYVLIYLACNDSPQVIQSIMGDKEYHAACRKCMKHPKTMEMEPVWIRGDLKSIPKDLMSSPNSD